KEQTTLTYEIPATSKISDTEKENIKRAVQRFYDTTLGPSAFNGGIIVAKGGNIIFEKYQGSVNLDGKDLITATTPLHIASVTKTFTAMAILKLHEDGKLNIDDSLSKYFSDFNYPGVTIKTLLNHRSGLPNYLYFMEKVGWPTDSIMQNKDVLKWLIERKGFIQDIGTADHRFNYCNTNYAMLALVIEKVTGNPYPAFMKEAIFDPIGMKNTFIHFLGNTKIRSKSFDWKGREIPDNNLDAVYGDKNMYSTVGDLLLWDRVLKDTAFLSQKTLEAAYTPYSNERPGIKNYGLGWRMNVYDDGKKIIFHNGWWHGNNASFIRLLKEDATIILISNRYAGAVYKAKNLANIFDNYFDAVEEEAETVSVVDTANLRPLLKKQKRMQNNLELKKSGKKIHSD
ncbi:MAG: beta-lactamase family protein, partial [Ferruginibacter sp.]|nr:beta-lactamase family protein [Ferruginibacter sp.]